MTDIRRIVDLYELCKCKRQVARETGTSPNIVRKYLSLVKKVREGTATEILPKHHLLRDRLRFSVSCLVFRHPRKK